MIAFLDGVVVRIDASGRMELLVGPVCFEIATPAGYDGTWSPGDDARVYTHAAITNEKLGLYGFAAAEDRDMFRLLLTASGVGPRMALSLLSLSAHAVVRAIALGEPRRLTAAAGVGAKMAEKIVLELKDKLGDLSRLAAVSPGAEGAEAAGGGQARKGAVSALGPAGGRGMDAVDALVHLGFPRRAALTAVAESEDALGASAQAADLIREALKRVRG